MDHLPPQRRLPSSVGLPSGAPSADVLASGSMPDDDWCERVAMELSPDLLVVVDPLLRAVWTNGAVERLLGIPRGEMLGTSVADHVHPDDLAVALGALNESQRSDGYHMATRIRVRRWDGTYLDTRVTATTTTAGEDVWMVLALRLVEDEVAIERRRAQLKALAQSVYVECAGMRWFELGDRVEGMLAALAGVVGARSVEMAELEGRDLVVAASWTGRGRRPRRRSPFDLVADAERLRLVPCVVTMATDYPIEVENRAGDRSDADASSSGDGTTMLVELWLDGDDGAVRLAFDGYAETWDDANADIVALMCSTMLATMRRCEQESEVNTRATRDPLTRLLNRDALHHRLADILAVSRPAERPVVLFVDLDNFKQTNDQYGHRVGDEVLCKVADAISSQVRSDDVAARIGGDEFVVVFQPAGVTTDELADRIRSTVDGVLAPWPHMSVSVGAIRVRPGETSEAALDRADREMYADKQRSRSIRSAPRS